jgi:AraC-like DNA-binding protein
MASPVTQHTIAIQQVQLILQGVRQRGLDEASLLQRAGISPKLLDSPLSRVTLAQYASLTFVLRRVTRDELWGLCSRPLKVGAFAQACQLLIHSPNLGHALRTGSQFFHLLLDDFAPRLQVAQAVATYRLVSVGPRKLGQSYAERVFLFFTHGLANWLVGRRVPLTEVIFPVQDRHLSTDAGLLFQAPLHYVGDSAAFRFEARWLDLPVVQNRQSLQEFLAQAPATLLVKYRDQASVTERIRRLLRRHLADELPSLESVSATLAMTPPTLRRRLAEEGQGYQAIKDDLRRDAAIDYLARPEWTLVDIASRLGYADASTFHRAFKGWTGRAPGEYRQLHMRP